MLRLLQSNFSNLDININIVECKFVLTDIANLDFKYKYKHSGM